MSSLFDVTPEPAPSLFAESPAAPEPYTVKRNGASYSVLDAAGLLALAFPCGSESTARAFCADLNAAFRLGWAARDAVRP